MGQNRFWVSNHPTYISAQEEKARAQNDNPDGIYQVRKGVSAGEEVFRLVERLKSDEVRIISGNKAKVKRGKRRVRRQVAI